MTVIKSVHKVSFMIMSLMNIPLQVKCFECNNELSLSLKIMNISERFSIVPAERSCNKTE